MRDDFKSTIKNTIARRAGYLCSNPSCRKLTVGANSDKTRSTLLGVASHITAASPGGPRFDLLMSTEERKSINNAIWLCHNCSTLIDKDANKYSREILHQWKDKIESETSNSLTKSNGEFISDNEVNKSRDNEKTIEEDLARIKENRVKKQSLEQFLNSSSIIIEAEKSIEVIINPLCG